MIRTRSLVAVLLLVSMPVVGSACADENLIGVDQRSVRVEPTALTLRVGDSAIVLATELDADRRPTRARVTFTSLPASIASVRMTSDSTAVVLALAVGTGGVTALSTRNGAGFTIPATITAR